MDIRSISLWVCIVVFVPPALFFGIKKILQNKKSIADFTRWGYPRWFMTVLGVMEVIAAIGLLFPVIRVYACYVYAIIFAGAIFTHFRAKENKEAIAPVCVLGLLISIYLLN